LRIDDAAREVIVHLRVGQVALFLAAGNQVLKLLGLPVTADFCALLAQEPSTPRKKMQTSNCTPLTGSNPELSLSSRNPGAPPRALRAPTSRRPMPSHPVVWQSEIVLARGLPRPRSGAGTGQARPRGRTRRAAAARPRPAVRGAGPAGRAASARAGLPS